MQPKMKQHSLPADAIYRLLTHARVARIGTINPDGSPYVVAVHFWAEDDMIYIHGRNAGQKIENIRRDPRVCVEIDEVLGFHTEQVISPCGASCAYESLVVTGTATELTDSAEKEYALTGLSKKYITSTQRWDMPAEKIAQTSVVAISIDHITGKYHPIPNPPPKA